MTLHFDRNNMHTAGEFKSYRKKVFTDMARVDGDFTVQTREGQLHCEDGYLAIDSHGWPYPIAKDEQEAIYEPVDQ